MTVPGTLYLSATPIGNLEDMTFRSVRILGEVGLIAAEDTRHTRKLLAHYDIHTPLTSYHEHNKLTKGPELIAYLQGGGDLVCVSDAGLPGIADPGTNTLFVSATKVERTCRTRAITSSPTTSTGGTI